MLARQPKAGTGPHRARETKHGIVRGIMAPVVALQHGSVEARELSKRPSDGETEGMLPVDELADQVVGVDLPALVVEVLEDLFPNDPALGLDGRKPRLTHDLR